MRIKRNNQKPAAPEHEEIRKALISAANASGKILKKYFGRPLKVAEKPGAGLVSNADLEAERAAVAILTRARPDFAFLTEEAQTPVSKRKSSTEVTSLKIAGRWIIDPLDGTTNFVHGFPMFCVSVAAEWDGNVQVGVIYHPILDETYYAVRGKGAFLISGGRKRRLKVSPRSEVKNALLTTGFTYRKDRFLRAEMKVFEELSELARAIRRPGSAALDLAYTARGVFDGFWERNLAPWDIAAGLLIVAEAGGVVTDFSGQSATVDSPAILAAAPLLHKELLRYLTLKTRSP